MKTVLAVDVGGTNIRLAIVSDKGRILEATRIPAHFSKKNISAQTLLSSLTACFLDFLQGRADVMAIGMGFPGFFQSNSGLLRSSPNLPLLQDIPLAKTLSGTLKKPVVVQNDALCAAIGEHQFGAGRDVPNMIHITLGTGVGAGLVLNNSPYLGEAGMAMELGHACVVPDSGARLCGCGNTGCLEAYASASAISALFAEQYGSQIPASDIYRLALDGNIQACKIVKQAGSYLGMAIAETVKLLDIRRITISGGLSGAWTLLYPALMHSLDTRLIPPLKGKITVQRSVLNDDAGLLGAARLALKHT